MTPPIWPFQRRTALRFEVYTKTFPHGEFIAMATFAEIGDAATYAVSQAYKAGCTHVQITDTLDRTAYSVEWTAQMLPHVVPVADEDPRS